MTDINSLFPSRFLRAQDLTGDTRCTIVGVTQEEVGDGIKPVLQFKEPALKGLVLNRTNANAIADQLGTDTHGWIGRVIVVHPAFTEFQGRRVSCIRVREQRTDHNQAPPPAHRPPPRHEAPPPPDHDDGWANGHHDSYR